MLMGERGVIFDLDGTLIASEGVYLRAWEAAARELGVEMTAGLYAEFVSLNRADTIVRLGEVLASCSLAAARAVIGRVCGLGDRRIQG